MEALQSLNMSQIARPVTQYHASQTEAIVRTSNFASFKLNEFQFKIVTVISISFQEY